MATVIADDALYTCRRCNIRVPAAQMSKSRKHGELHIYGVYLPCVTADKRRRERRLVNADRGEDGALVEAVAECDPWPAQLLAVLLREDRDRWGFSFDLAWREDVAFVVAHIDDGQQRRSWRAVLIDTREAWSAAFKNVPGPGWGLTGSLLDELVHTPARCNPLAANPLADDRG